MGNACYSKNQIVFNGLMSRQLPVVLEVGGDIVHDGGEKGDHLVLLIAAIHQVQQRGQ